MMTDESKKLKLTFAPGCFDHFEGTQEELDQLIKDIEAAFESGDFLENSVAVEDLPEDELQELLTHFEETDRTDRRLQ
jgi:molybdenum cofactor biosynthesis enzyme MoaA